MNPRPKIASIGPRVEKIDLRMGSPASIPRIRGWKLMQIRERILWRDQFTCRVCGREWLDITRLVVDHVVPLHLGGAESDENRVSICIACHALKSEREEKQRNNIE